jgi:hypothetical protein
MLGNHVVPPEMTRYDPLTFPIGHEETACPVGPRGLD